MESLVPSPVKRAKQLVEEEMEQQDASEQDIASIVALGFERDLAIEALDGTVSIFYKQKKKYMQRNNLI